MAERQQLYDKAIGNRGDKLPQSCCDSILPDVSELKR
jgi:hypothetical protein